MQIDVGFSEDSLSTKWDLMSSFFYSLIVMTTIGYGDVVPKTIAGKMATVFYAIVGIPLMLIFLSNIGYFLARLFKFVYWKLWYKYCLKNEKPRDLANRLKNIIMLRKVTHQCVETSRKKSLSSNFINYDHQQAQNIINSSDNCKEMININQSQDKTDERDQPQTSIVVVTESDDNLDENDSEKDSENDYDKDANIPVIVCLTIVICYLCGGGFLFKGIENWAFIDAFYFCFVTLATIGFGDFVPTNEQEINDKEFNLIKSSSIANLIYCSLYLLFGMVLLTMSFNLIKQSVANTIKNIAKKIGLISKNKKSNY